MALINSYEDANLSEFISDEENEETNTNNRESSKENEGNELDASNSNCKDSSKAINDVESTQDEFSSEVEVEVPQRITSAKQLAETHGSAFDHGNKDDQIMENTSNTQVSRSIEHTPNLVEKTIIKHKNSAPSSLLHYYMMNEELSDPFAFDEFDRLSKSFSLKR